MLRKIIYFLAITALIPAMAVAEVTLQLQCSRTKIFQGESFNITLSINGADGNIEQPDFASSDPAEITFLGSHSNNRSSIQIINGKFSREVFRGRVLSYSIKPKQAGVFRTGPIIVRVNGKPIRHEGISVRVKGLDKQDNVIVSVKASSTSVLVEEPFTITLSIDIKELPGQYRSNIEPIHPNYLPHISAGFLEIKDEKDDLVRPDLNKILSKLIDQSGRQSAFQINNYQSRGMGFGSFFDSDPFKARPLRFHLKDKSVKINGLRYREYSLTLPYSATGEGEHVFGPVTFKGQVISHINDQQQAALMEVYTIGPAVTVRVIPPPDEGRPDEFIGSVGKKLTAVAQFDTSVCKVGDPLTLTLEITGDISISNMRAPVLNLQPELIKDFKIYDDNVKTATLKNGKRFIYRVRPTKAGTLEFPPIKIAYFDTDIRAYKLITTAALPLQAEFTTQVSAGPDGGNGGIIEVKRSMPLPCGITLSETGVSNESLLPGIKLILILTLTAPLLVLLTIVLPSLLKSTRNIKSRRKRSRAITVALKHAKRAKSAADLSHALREWFTERLGVSGHALTANECRVLLADNNVPGDICMEFSSLIAALDEAMYKPEAGSDLPKERCAEILKRADTALNTKKTKMEDEL